MVRNTPPSTTIERKTFSLTGGESIYLTEATKERSFTLSLKQESHPWLVSRFTELLEASLNHKLFTKCRLDAYDLWVEKLTTRKGHYVEIVKLGANGGLNKIIVPVGTNKSGLKSFLSLLKAFNNHQSLVINTTPSYKDALKVSPQSNRPVNPSNKQTVVTHNKISPNQNTNKYELADFYPEKVVIIYREHFHDEWFQIIKAVQLDITNSGSICPLQPDRALLSVLDREQGITLCKNKGWQKAGPYRVRFEPWSAEAYTRDLKVPSYGGWIKVRNLPMDIWSFDTFVKIGNACGGYLETTNKTLARMDMMEVCIKVKENPKGFLPSTILLQSTTTSSISIHIEPFFVASYSINFIAGIHGKYPPMKSTTITPRADEVSPYPEIAFEVQRTHMPTVAPFHRSSSNEQQYFVKESTLHPSGNSTTPVLPIVSQISSYQPDASINTLQHHPIQQPTLSDLALPTLPNNADNNALHTHPNPLDNITLPTYPLDNNSLPNQPDASINTHQHHPIHQPTFFDLALPTLPNPMDNNLTYPQPLPINPSPILKPIVINKKVSHLVAGKFYSTNTKRHFSDSDDLLSSPCSHSSTPKIKTSDHMDFSPTSISCLFEQTFESSEQAHPLAIAPLAIQQLQPLNDPLSIDTEQACRNGIDTDDMMEGPEEEYIDDPSQHLTALFPWMRKYGMCIMPLPSKQKQATIPKKKRNWVRELVNLQSSVNYSKGSTNHALNIDG